MGPADRRINHSRSADAGKSTTTESVSMWDFKKAMNINQGASGELRPQREVRHEKFSDKTHRSDILNAPAG